MLRDDSAHEARLLPPCQLNTEHYAATPSDLELKAASRSRN